MIYNMRKNQTKTGQKVLITCFISGKCYLFNKVLLDDFHVRFYASHNYQKDWGYELGRSVLVQNYSLLEIEFMAMLKN